MEEVSQVNSAETLLDRILAFIGEVISFGTSFLVPGWRLYQLIIIALVLVAVILIDKLTHKPIRVWMRNLRGRPKWQLRLFVVTHRRIRLILFVILMWTVVYFMQLVTWPSRSYILANVANIATALLVVVIVVRLIRNRAMRRFVMWGAWIYVTLYYLGQIDETSSLLDSVVIESGASRFSMLTIVKAGIVLIGIFMLVRFVTSAAATQINRNKDISPSMRVLLIKGIQLGLYVTSFFVGLNIIGFDLTGLTFLSGAIGVGIGFGLQKVVSNLVSGVIILMDKSIKPGDVISLGETFGWINALGARYVSVVTRDGREYLIPNEDLITGQVVNWSHSDAYVRLDINFGTSYGCDPHDVRRIAIAATSRVRRVLKKPNAPVCHIVEFGGSSVDYVLRFWISDPTAGLTNVRGDVFLALWDAFKENDISLPFPQREVRILPSKSESEP